MEDFKIVLVFDQKLCASYQPQVLSFSTREAAEEAIVQLNKSSLRNIIETVNVGSVRRSSMIADIYRLYQVK
jgi:predicted signal transduction protein with EAL and GGDEF domain